MRSNPGNEHNAGIAMSSKDIQGQNNGTGNMYQGQGGRAFVQSGGGMSQFHSFDGGNPDSAYARGSYAPVTVGYNSITRGGSRRRRGRRHGRDTKRKSRRSRKTIKRNCDIVTMIDRRRRHCNCNKKSCRICTHYRFRRNSSKYKQQGGNGGGLFANAAYSIAGPNTGVGRDTSALANPAPHTAYNSCHPVS